MMYGLEIVALTKRQEVELEEMELKVLKLSLRVMRMDKIRNEYIRGTAQAGLFGDRVRLRRFRHVWRAVDVVNQ